MSPSIRRSIVINLLIAVAVIVVLTAVGIYYVTSSKLEKHIDAELISSNLMFQAVLGDSARTKTSTIDVQKSLSAIPKEHNEIMRRYPKLADNLNIKNYTAVRQYQVYNAAGTLILHSAGAPTIPLSDGKNGFSNTYMNHASWRIYTYKYPQTKITVIVAERFNQLHILRNAIVTNNIIVMLICFPFLGLLIWLIVNFRLKAIKRVSSEIAQRAPTYLESVDLKRIPVELQSLIDELNKLFARLRQAFGREQRFAADAAHELRTPMAAIKTQTQVALNSDSDEELKLALKKILAGVDRSTHVVQQLLTLSRLNPGSALDKQQAVNMVAITTEIISELYPLALNNKAELEFICDKDKISLLGNAASLGILIRNLIDNAIRYTPDDGTGEVKVSLTQTQDTVILKVADNGPGIPEKLHSRVFERFFRVLGSQKPGSGLGLAIVQQISSMHHAKLTLSKPDAHSGLVVTITFSNRLGE